MRNKMIKTAESAVWQNQAGMQASLPRRVCIRRVFRVPLKNAAKYSCHSLTQGRSMCDISPDLTDRISIVVSYKSIAKRNVKAG